MLCGALLLLAQVVAVRNGTLIEREGDVAHVTVIIRGDRIEGVGANLPIPAGAEIVDAGGAFIVPGFIDNHVHVGRTGVAREWAQSGVTTLIDNGSSVPTPGVVSCGRIITARGGYPAVGSTDSPALEVSSIEEVERYLDDARPDCVKIAIERGFLADYDDDGWPTLSPELVKAIVDAAHARKLLVRAHVTQAGELAVAVDAGVDVIAHTPIEPVPFDLLRKAAEKKIIFITTAAVWNERRIEKIVVDNLFRYFLLARGRIAIGTDYPNLPQAGISAELQALSRGAPSIPAIRILDALTRDGAAAAGREDLGRIAPGARADVVILAASPRDGVKAFDSVLAVIRGGEVVRNDPTVRLLEEWVGTWYIRSTTTSSNGETLREEGTRTCKLAAGGAAIRCVDETHVTWSCGSFNALPPKSTVVSTIAFNHDTGQFEMTTVAGGTTRTDPFDYHIGGMMSWTVDLDAQHIDSRLQRITSTAWQLLRNTCSSADLRTETQERWFLLNPRTSADPSPRDPQSRR